MLTSYYRYLGSIAKLQICDIDHFSKTLFEFKKLYINHLTI